MSLLKSLCKPVLKNNFNKFLTELKHDEIYYIEEKCNDLMSFFQYKRNTVENYLALEQIEKQILEIENDANNSKNQLVSNEEELRTNRINSIKRILNRNLI